jgi:hypothetical protein
MRATCPRQGLVKAKDSNKYSQRIQDRLYKHASRMWNRLFLAALQDRLLNIGSSLRWVNVFYFIDQVIHFPRFRTLEFLHYNSMPGLAHFVFRPVIQHFLQRHWKFSTHKIEETVIHRKGEFHPKNLRAVRCISRSSTCTFGRANCKIWLYFLTPKPFCMPGTNFISLQDARDMATAYRNQKETMLKTNLQNQGILPICETFGRAAFDTILGDSAVQKIRIYLCLINNKVRIMAVGVDANDEDMLPSGTEDKIIEEGQRCPDICPPPSALNGF